MADYNIYIHDLSGNAEGQNFTKAWGAGNASPTKAWQSGGDEVAGGGEGGGLGTFAAFKAVGQMVKSHPYVAAAVAAFTAGTAMTAKAIEAILPYQSSMTGNYYYSDRWQNIKAAFKMIINPLGAAMSEQAMYMEFKKASYQQSQQAQLIGDSYVNSITRKV